MKKDETISRRGFVKCLGVGTGTLALAGLGSTMPAPATAASNALTGDEKSVLVDIPKCIGCGSCQEGCKTWNNRLPEATEFTDNWLNPPKETTKTWTIIKPYYMEKDGRTTRRFVKEQCMHCLSPACVSACPVTALTKNKDGAVVYDDNLCIGCRYCMVACPYFKVNFEWEETFPRISKCHFCFDRIPRGDLPACVEACPTGTLTFGPRSTIIQKAKERITERKHYVGHIFGEKEIGGSGWMYISDVPFEQLGFPVGFDTKPLPDITWKSLTKIPYLAPGIAVFLTGIYYYTDRKYKVAQEEQSQDEKGEV